MLKKKRLIVGNWKMNSAKTDEAKALVRTVKRKTARMRRSEVVFCPPALYLSDIAKLVSGKYAVGAQNTFYEDKGSFTGEISPSQIRNVGASYVILGHSERRAMGETDKEVAAKVNAALRNRLRPIVCIGEAVHDSDGEYLQVIKDQLTASLIGVTKGTIADVVIAYEPIWAIGAIDAMSPRDLHEMTLYIKKCLQTLFGSYASSVPVLYGGAVNPMNAKEIVSEGFVDGLLVGRDSLDADNFSKIIMMTDQIK